MELELLEDLELEPTLEPLGEACFLWLGLGFAALALAFFFALPLGAADRFPRLADESALALSTASSVRT